MVVEQFKRALKGHPLKQQQRMAADLARRNALSSAEYDDLKFFIKYDQEMQRALQMARESPEVREYIVNEYQELTACKKKKD